MRKGEAVVIDQARDFVLSQVDDPALAHPELDEEIKGHVRSSKTLVRNFKKTGDLYRYLKRFGTPPAPGKSKVYDSFKILGLMAYEDIVPEFENRFHNYFDELTTLDDFVIGETYTSWDIAIFARTYNCQSGIYLIGEEPNYQAIFVKATLNGGKYPNHWLVSDEELKYYLYSLKNKFSPDYKVNRAIINSGNIPIYVFIKKDAKCTLTGVFRYIEYVTEADDSKWFRLRKVDSLSVATMVSQVEYDKDLEHRVHLSTNLSSSERERRLQSAPKKPEQIQTIVNTYKRNADVITTVLERANGICEGCNAPAPFLRVKDNTPYLEVHHIIPLGEGGDDTIVNVIALCPNCHRKAHFG